MPTLITILATIYFFIICGFVGQVILNYSNTNPVKTVGWILAIVFIPILGLLMYLVVGRNLRRRQFRYRRLRDAMKKSGRIHYGFDEDCDYYISEQYKVLNRLLINLTYMPVFPANTVEIYASGAEKFAKMFEDFENATETINIIYYAIGDDNIGQEFKNMLIRKAKQGVEVRLLYDDMGCNKTKRRYFQEMTEAGISVEVFFPIRFPRVIRSVNYRNHKKIVVIDGKIAYTGGINVQDQYIKGVEWGVWRDLAFRIEGAGAQGFQMNFVTDWFYSHGEFINNRRFFPSVGTVGGNPMQIASAEPMGYTANIMQGMLAAIARARKYIYIESPYIVPTDEILTAIQNAGLSGIDVKLIMPQKSDNPKVQFASNTYVSQLLASRVKVYQYTAGFIHSKMIIVDDELTIAGSSNMDMRSFELNFEANVFIYDKETAAKAMKIFQEDLKMSVCIHAEYWNVRSVWIKFREAFFRLFSPLL